ncbi:hypothetical protein KL911_001684 [Ogataea haglerorum]|uniref:uncharacterized protein n=1 Tax=Ogataea haglerorum TaxID=1937702 RepID=UPI001C8AC43F|nr:uncharacterized protein KL911_001684 [Ogataea haglerorum]KAG7755627.1 hypothetical protein KL911_001684 [Ogataea haglerorum]
MEFDFPSLIVDSNSSYTKAGLSTFDIPSVVLPTVYSRESVDKGDYVFGDDIDLYPQNNIYTMYSEGIVYNWDAMAQHWAQLYSDLKLKSNESPLVVTENAWNTKKNKVKACQVAFEELEVPIFSLLKRQLCTAFAVSKPSSSIVVDIDDDIVSVTPISNGSVLTKGIQFTKFGGDFLSPFALDFIQSKFPNEPVDAFLIPKPFQSVPMSESFRTYQISTSLAEFKNVLLHASLYPMSPDQQNLPPQTNYPQYESHSQIEFRNYELPNRRLIQDIGIEQYKLAEPLFNPAEYSKKLPHLKVPQDAEGISNLILKSMKSLEAPATLYMELLKNIVFTGSLSGIPNLEHRIAQDLARLISDYTIITYLSPDTVERQFDSWVGANVLTSSSVGDFDNLFISKEEYQENGEDYIVEKFK